MNDDYEIGKYRPPVEHQFKPGNQAAKGQRRKKAGVISLSDIAAKAITKRIKVRRGTQIVASTAGEVMIQRLVNYMTSGTAREIALAIAFIERHAPQFLTRSAEAWRVELHVAQGSTVPLPPVELWEPER